MHSLFGTHGATLLPLFDQLLPTFASMLVSRSTDFEMGRPAPKQVKDYDSIVHPYRLKTDQALTSNGHFVCLTIYWSLQAQCVVLSLTESEIILFMLLHIRRVCFNLTLSSQSAIKYQEFFLPAMLKCVCDKSPPVRQVHTLNGVKRNYMIVCVL